MELNIYKGKRVLLTGHTGFKGSWLALWLQSLGAKVCGVALPLETQSHFDLLKLDIESHLVDIRDGIKITSIFESFKPEIVFHLAAQPLVRSSYKDPVETYSTNVMGTLNVFEASRKVGVRAIVSITTDKCYENKEWLWGYREEDALGGYDPYSSSKACAEILAASYRQSYFNLNEYGVKHNTLLATARAGNVIGGGDWSIDRLIPDIIRATAKGEKVIIRNPGATRPWQHVLEPLYGYLLLGKKLLEGNKDFAEAWNFGPEISANVSVAEVLEAMKKIWPSIGFEIQKDPNAPHEANLLTLDCTKAKRKLGWKPRLEFNDTVKMTVNWYREFYSNGKVETANQLQGFIAKVMN